MKSAKLGAVALIAVFAAMSTANAKTLVFCAEGAPEGFDPALYTLPATFDASSRTVFNRLVEFERGTTVVQPGLAESWEVSEDGLEIVFSLRAGVSFHSSDLFNPSRDFNADDVIFSFERQMKANDDVPGVTWEYFNGMAMPDLIKEIVKVDDMTVKFELSRPEAPMIANLAMGFASIQSAEYAEAMEAAGTPEMLNQAPIGTGPFMFQSYDTNAEIRYAAHADYWEGKAPIDELVFAITPDASVRYEKLKAGECHVTVNPNPADLETMEADTDVDLLRREGLNIGYLAYNTQQAPFDNPNVRKALNMAIDKQAILDAVFAGTGEVAVNPLPPTIWAHKKDLEDDGYDAEAAMAMLAEEGVENLEMKIWALPVATAYNPDGQQMAELLKADFEKVGVTVEIVSYEWGEYLARSREVDRDGAVLLGWTGDNGDPDNFLNVGLSCDGVGGSNRAQWCHEPFEEVLQQARATFDVEERAALYEQAQVIFKEQAPWATIAHSVVFQPVRKEVQDWKIDPFGGNRFYGVDLEEIELEEPEAEEAEAEAESGEAESED